MPAALRDWMSRGTVDGESFGEDIGIENSYQADGRGFVIEEFSKKQRHLDRLKTFGRRFKVLKFCHIIRNI